MGRTLAQVDVPNWISGNLKFEQRPYQVDKSLKDLIQFMQNVDKLKLPATNTPPNII